LFNKLNEFEEYSKKVISWINSTRGHFKEYIIEDFPPKKLPDPPESPYSKKELAEFEKQSKLEFKKYKKEQRLLLKKTNKIISNG
jgi:hypothetical protein